MRKAVKKCGAHTNIAHQLKDIFKKLDNDEPITVVPNGLVTAIYTHFKQHIVPGEQQDIVELWMLVAERIAKETGVKYENPQLDGLDGQVESVRQMYNEGLHSPWSETVQGTQISVTSCTCGHQQGNIEIFASITLDMCGSSITEMLQKYLAKEKLEGYKCDKCESLGNSTKHVLLWKLPKTLVVSLKRFRVDAGRYVKINTRVNIEESFAIGTKDGEITYNLRSFAEHHGGYNGGHYVSFGKTSGSWKLYDDADVHNLGDQMKYNGSAVYFLVYESDNRTVSA
jgi:uncharacterized UBP type Zn finger protein